MFALIALMSGCTPEVREEHQGCPECRGMSSGGWLATSTSTGGSIDSGGRDSGLPLAPIDPIAVGFELVGAVREDGSLGDYRYPGSAPIPTAVTLLFAGAGYFYDDDDDDRCIVVGTFEPPLRACDLPNEHDADLWNSYEGTLHLEDNLCAGRLDESVWGENGLELIQQFEGMRLGFGFGPMTEYLADGWDPDVFAEEGRYLFASYVAITDPDGSFVGEDWNSASLYELDPVSKELVVDGAGELIRLEPATFGTSLPEGFLWPFVQWYQDFPLIDFEKLDDPGTTTTGDCEPAETGDTGTAPTTPPTTPPDDEVPEVVPDEEEAEKGGCGCASAGTAQGAALGALVLALAGPRRRRVQVS